MNIIKIQTKIRRLKYYFSSSFLTVDNLILGVVLILAISWIWGSISAMGRNFELNQLLEIKNREAQIAEIEHQKLQYENKYLQSEEYQELAARENLGLVKKGESVLILANYPKSKPKENLSGTEKSNFIQWINFLFGGNL